LRVLYFHQYFSTPEGAAGTRSYEVAQVLVARGHQVTMVCGSGARLRIPKLKVVGGCMLGSLAGIDVIQYDLPYSNRDSFLKRATTFMRFAIRSVGVAFSAEYDLIYASSTPLTASIPGVVAKLARRGKPFVFEVRDLWPELPKAMGVIRNPLVLAAMSVLEWLSYRCADFCIGLAPGIVDGIRRVGPRGLEVEMIPNSCDLELFHPTVQPVSMPGIGDEDFVAIFTGAHGIANGLGAVLDAAAELKKRGRGDIRFVFIGDGNRKDELVECAHSSGLDNCVFLNPVPKSELPRFLARASVGLMILDNIPAFYNGTSPNKFFDYISSGLPVLTNYPGWIAEIVDEHVCGVSVEPGDASSFADAMERLADSSEDLGVMGRNARCLAESKFNRKELCERLVMSLERIVYGAESR